MRRKITGSNFISIGGFSNQIKDELADFISYCMVPNSSLPRFEPLLRPTEIERSIEIIEALPLGQGDVPWNEYLSALRDCGHAEWLTIERETGENPAEDIADAIRFLHSFTLR